MSAPSPPNPLTERFDVFISYAGTDHEAVGAIVERLQLAGVRPWFDRQQIPAGDVLARRLQEGLRDSYRVAVFVTPTMVHRWRAGSGRWQGEEADLALRIAVEQGRTKVFFVVLPGVPADLRLDELDGFIAGRRAVDLRGGAETDQELEPLVRAARGEPEADAPGLARDAAEAPYKGLEFFDEADADNFFGREHDVERVLGRLGEGRLLFVVGASGSGKSSLVRAGVIPKLRAGALAGSERWRIQVFRPSRQPLLTLAGALAALGGVRGPAEIAAALERDERALNAEVEAALRDARSDERALLVVDQLEEVFAPGTRQDAQRAFIANLLGAAGEQSGRTVVIATLRADFYAQAVALPGLAAALSSSQQVLGPLSRDELRRAIEQPALRAGLTLGPGLVAEVLDDAGNEPGSLPLVQHALLEVWACHAGSTLTVADYHAVGGVRGALAQRADQTYASLSAAEQAEVRRIFRRLTRPGQGTEDTRRRAALAELVPAGAGEAEVRRLVDRFAGARLVTTDQQDADVVVDVAHEALVRGWPSLRRWVDEDREGLQLLQQLAADAQEWVAQGREEAQLYRGTRLARVREWADEHPGELTSIERRFLNAAIVRELAEQRAQADARLRADLRRRRDEEAERRRLEGERQREEEEREREEARRLERERGRTRIRNRVIVGLAGVLVLLAGLGAWALQQRSAADERAREARSIAEATRSEALLAPPTPSAGGFQLAQHAFETDQSPRSELALRLAAYFPGRRLIDTGHGGVRALALTGDGHIVTGSVDGALRVWDPESRERARQTIATGHGEIWALALTGDGDIVTGSQDGALQVWDIQSERAMTSIDTGDSSVTDLALTDDSDIVVGNAIGELQVWDPKSGEHASPTIDTGRLGITELAVAGDDIVTASYNGLLRVWDAESGERAGPAIDTGQLGVSAMALTEDGKSVIGNAGGELQVWDPKSGEQASPTIDTGKFGVTELAVAGGDIVTASSNGLLRVWDAESGERTTKPIATGHGEIWALALTGDRDIVTGSQDGALQVWDPQSGAPRARGITTDHGGVLALALTGDEDIVTGNGDGELQVWDSAVWDPESSDRARMSIDTGNFSVTELALTKNGDIAVGNAGGELQVWDSKSGERAGPTIDTGQSGVGAMALTENGDIVVGNGGGELQVWDPKSGERTGPTIDTGHSRVGAMALTENGDIVTGSQDGALQVWDPQSGERAGPTIDTGQFGVGAMALTEDGDLVTGTDGGVLQVWDLSSERATTTTATGRGPLYDLALSADGDIVTGSDGAVEWWDPEGRNITTITNSTSTGAAYLAVALTGDGGIVTGSYDVIDTAAGPEEYGTLAWVADAYLTSDEAIDISKEWKLH